MKIFLNILLALSFLLVSAFALDATNKTKTTIALESVEYAGVYKCPGGAEVADWPDCPEWEWGEY